MNDPLHQCLPKITAALAPKNSPLLGHLHSHASRARANGWPQSLVKIGKPSNPDPHAAIVVAVVAGGDERLVATPLKLTAKELNAIRGRSLTAAEAVRRWSPRDRAACAAAVDALLADRKTPASAPASKPAAAKIKPAAKPDAAPTAPSSASPPSATPRLSGAKQMAFLELLERKGSVCSDDEEFVAALGRNNKNVNRVLEGLRKNLQRTGQRVVAKRVTVYRLE